MEVILTEAVKSAVSASIKARLGRDPNSTANIDHTNLITRHIISIYKWSENIQFLGLSQPKLVDSSTVKLRINRLPRRFRPEGSIKKVFNEEDLINSKSSYILLGDPGSGKTTTLKRIVQKLLISDSDDDVDIYVPIVIRLREIAEYTSLPQVIADLLYIPYVLEEKGGRNYLKI